MNKQVPLDSVEERLRKFAEAPDLSASLRDQAQRFLSRLVSPVRVTLLGRPTPGKASILAAAIGEPLLPALDQPPTLELRYGEQASAQVTRPDGSVAEPTGELDSETFSDAILAVLERPVPLLRRISFLDVQADDTLADQRAAIAWAAARTDIALWCAERFDDRDRELWADVPEQIKDHAYLVLTDCTADEADRVKAEVVDEFQDVYPLDFKQAEASTGVEALTDRLLEHARIGRQADADSALLFLRAQDAARTDKSGRRTTRPVTRPVTRPITRPVSRPRTRPITVPVEASRPVSRPISKPAPADNAAIFELFSAGLLLIRSRGDALLKRARSEAEIDGSTYAEVCGETLEQLTDMLTSHDESHDPKVTRVTDAVMEAENLVVLMQNEKGAQPALDAVALLLQVRRDFEANLAA